MRRSHAALAATIGLALALALAPASEAKRRKDRVPPELQAVVARAATQRANFFVRNAFDTDPSPYQGRFVPRDAGPLEVDDAAAMQTRCSEYITYREVDGGNVEYDEYFNASTGVSASLGLPKLTSQIAELGASVDYGSGAVARVRYTLTRKLVATIEDPDAFAECCETVPGGCTDRYLGEFLEGTGEIFHFSGREVGVGAHGGVKGVSLGVEVKDGVEWNRAVQFPEPVFFAMKVTRVPPDLVPVFDACGGWRSEIPRSARGQYFVGMSDAVAGERAAREAARRDARVQVVQYLGERIQVNRDGVVAAADGVAELVKDHAWCVEPDAGGGTTATVLAFLPRSEEDRAVDRIARRRAAEQALDEGLAAMAAEVAGRDAPLLYLEPPVWATGCAAAEVGPYLTTRLQNHLGRAGSTQLVLRPEAGRAPARMHLRLARGPSGVTITGMLREPGAAGWTPLAGPEFPGELFGIDEGAGASCRTDGDLGLDDSHRAGSGDLQVWVDIAGNQGRFCEGERAETVVRVSAPARVQIYDVQRDGSAELLWPPPGQPGLVIRDEYSLGAWELTPTAGGGDERLVAVAVPEGGDFGARDGWTGHCRVPGTFGDDHYPPGAAVGTATFSVVGQGIGVCPAVSREAPAAGAPAPICGQ